jgi:hypothetical protein
MRLRSVLLAGGAAAAAVVLVRRRAATAERVEVAYPDGSAVTLEPGSGSRDRLLALGREALAAARG